MNSLKICKYIFYIVVLQLVITTKALALEDPMKFMDKLINNVINDIKDNKNKANNSNEYNYKIISKHILPHIDFVEMSKWIAGRNAWQNASSKDKDKFVSEFSKLVINTYATALNKYSNQTVEFLPLRGDVKDKARVQINSKIIKGVEHINVSYRLKSNGNSWMLYDMIIEGVSILKGYQAQFSDQIRQHGLNAAIKKIQQHNSNKS